MKNIIIHLFYNLLVKPILKYIIGVHFENSEELPPSSPFIIVANHNSHLDAIAIRAALSLHGKKTTYTVVAKEYFDTGPLARWAMHCFLNAIFICRNRQPGQESPIQLMDSYLQKGKSLILFPEGTRGQAGVVENFKKGIAILLQKHPEIPFIPVHINGFGRVLPKNSSLCLPLPCKVRFGKPIFIQSTDIDSILHQVQQAIFDLKPNEEPDSNRFQLDY